VLLVGAHSDDIEIGAGGTVLRLVEEDPGIEVVWVVLAARGERADEAASSADRFLKGARRSQVRVESFRERYFPHLPELKEYFDRLGREVAPDLVVCPWQGDAHQDHRTSAELVMNTFRRQTVFQYEVAKVDGDLGRPNIYVNLAEETVARKVDLLMEGFPSQHARPWFEPGVFKAIMRIRGMESQAGSGFAEAFHCPRLIVRP
jgi:LmbE family N-acetylglucosaminyl deacetylase